MAKRPVTYEEAQIFARRVVIFHALGFGLLSLGFFAIRLSAWKLFLGIPAPAPQAGSSGPLLGPDELMTMLGFVFASYAAMLMQLPAPVGPKVLLALGLFDAPVAMFTLVTMRYGAGKTAPFLQSRAGWALVILLVLFTSLVWMAWERLQRAVKATAGQGKQGLNAETQDSATPKPAKHRKHQ